MINPNAALEDLKDRARKGDLAALQELRNRGFFPGKKPAAEGFEVSSAQRRLWILDQMSAERSAYNLPQAVLLEGELDGSAFRRALDTVVRRHESFRTVFAEVGGEPRQLVREKIDFALEHIDLAGQTDPVEAARTAVARQAHMPFDLSNGPLLRVSLLRLAPALQVFLFSAHHIICDGWSLGIFAAEVGTLYNAFVAGRENPLPTLKLQYKDFAVWQNAQLRGEETRAHREYWHSKLSAELSLLDIGDCPRPAVQTFAGRTLFSTIDPVLLEQFERLSREHGATLFISLLAAVKVLLYKYCRQVDVIVGSPIAGRDHSDLENQIGMYVNLLAFRDRIDRNDPFTVFLKRVRQTAFEAYEHQTYPFDWLVGELNLDRDLSRPPVFNVAVVFEEDDPRNLELDGLCAKEFDTGYSIAKFDLTIFFSRIPAGLGVAFNFNSDLFTDDRMRRMTSHFGQLVGSIVEDPRKPVRSLGLLSGEELGQLIGFGMERRDYPAGRTIASVFEEQVERGPAREAVVCEGVGWTYRELNQRANGVARALRERFEMDPLDPWSEPCVGVLLDRSEQVAAALVGILKAGGAYVPLDPSYPRPRMEYILRQSGCRVLVTESKYLEDGRGLVEGIESLDVRDIGPMEGCSENPSPVGTGRTLSYVIYTSGSTGPPKGNLIEQRSVLRLVRNTNYIELNERERILQTGSLAFDASTFEIWGALLNGGAVVFAPEAVLLEAGQLKQRIRQQQVTTMWLTSSLFNQMVDADQEIFATLGQLLVGGEKLSPGHVNRVRRRYPELKVINGYGPTENSTFTACYQIDRDYREDIPIGKPIANSEVVVVDGDGELAPVGVRGEICAGGDGLSRGYVGDAAATAEKYVPHPYRAGERLYRTGDLGRWRSDGVLEYLGRRDAQVKVRGYRIEPGEIENRLLEHEAVREAVVVSRVFATGDCRLVAYIAGGHEIDEEALRTHLRSTLPEYMIPAHFVQLRHLPLSGSGKVDRQRLPELPDVSRHGVWSEPPRTSMERKLAAIWQDLLGTAPESIHDSFFESGGHSLKAIQLVSRIYLELNARISLRDVFQTPTIAGLAAQVEKAVPAPYMPIECIPEAGHYAVSQAQWRLWVLEKMGAPAGAYNIPGGFELRGRLDIPALRDAMHTLVERHESLRTTFTEVDGRPRQVIHRDIGFDLEIEDRDGQPFPASGNLSDDPALFPHWSFNLERGPLFSARLLRFGNQRYLFLFNMHHIVSDGWSVQILLRELVQIYLGESLPPLSIQYKDYAAWQNRMLADAAIEPHRGYWLQKLSGELPLLDMGMDHPRPPVQTFRGRVLPFRLAPEISSALRKLGRSQGASDLVTLLALVKVLFSRYCGQSDIIVGSPVSWRDHPDLQNQIGFYVNLLALRDRVHGRDSFLTVVQKVRDTVQEGIEHRVYPYDRLVEDLDLRRDMSRNPLFDCVVTFESVRHWASYPSGRVSPDLEVRSFEIQTTTSKFDLTVSFNEDISGAYHAAIEYNTDLFARDRIERLAAHLQELAKSAAMAPDRPVRTLNILSEGKRSLLESWSRETRRYESGRTIASVFEEQAERGPAREAVVCEGVRWTYGELNQRANGVARALRERLGMNPDGEPRVGVLLDRSEQVAAALVGILKAGGAYVPLDPSYPRQRMEYILRQSGCRVLVTESKYMEDGRGLVEGIESLDVRDIGPMEGCSENPPPVGTGRNLAYVIYTSGSTGPPKGNLIEQRSVLRLVRNTNYIELSERERILQTGSLAFDASTFEIWGALLNGGAVVFAPEAVLLDAGQLKQRIRQQQVTTMWLTSSLFNQMVDADLDGNGDGDGEIFATLGQLLVGGEKLSPAHVNRVRRRYPELKVINGYGPTENTTFTACYRIEGEYREDIPIGKPIANTEVVILDRDGEVAPVGVRGEICAGGDGLSRGYVGDAEATAEKYVPHPYRTGERLYRTGDLGRWRSDGVLEYLGRSDTQVKVRGYRIEPGEIENRLLDHNAVTEAVVIAMERPDASKKLVAYYSAKHRISPGVLRSHLAAALPPYMIPSDFVALDRLPLTANGKLDRLALPEPGRGHDANDVLQGQAETGLELQLVNLFKDVLGCGRVGIDENYFELGGDSIRAIQLVSRLRREGLYLEVGNLFANPTIRQLAPLLTRTEPESGRETVRGAVPLTAIQRWFFQNAGPLHHFNQAVLLHPTGRLDENALRVLIRKLLHHHDGLRMVYRFGDGEIQQINRGPEDVLPDFSVVSIPAEEIEHHADRMQRGIDLSKGPLIKVVLYRLEDGGMSGANASPTGRSDQVMSGANASPTGRSDQVMSGANASPTGRSDQNRLLIIVHHLVVDGVSWRVLLEDLESGYRRLAAGQEVDFGPKTASFKAWSEAAVRFAGSPQLREELNYWLGVSVESSLALGPAPPLGERVENPGVFSSRLSREHTALLLGAAHRAYHTETNDLLLTALGRALKRWRLKDATVITLEGHGREDLGEVLDVSRTVGWFTSLFPFRLQTVGSDIGLQIKSVKEDLRRVPKKGIGFGMLRYLADDDIRARLADTRAPGVSFNYLGQFEIGRTGLFGLAQESSGQAISPTIESSHELDITAIVLDERLEFSVIRNRTADLTHSASELLTHFEEELIAVAEHCRACDRREKTPSDFTYKALSLADYQELLESNRWPASDIDDVCPLTSMQEGLLFQILYDQDPRSYFIQMSFCVRGKLDIEAFRNAWITLSNRHVVLRSGFIHEGLPRPLQVVFRERHPEFDVLNFADHAEDEQGRRIDAYRRQDLARGFDVNRDPLMRFAMIELGDSRHHMVWSYHHLILDGWSFSIVCREFREIYEALCQGRAPAAAPAAPYSGYIRWLEQRNVQAGREHWSGYLAGYKQLATLRRNASGSAEPYEPRELTLDLDQVSTAKLGELAVRHQVTLSSAVQALWGLLLARYNDADDVIFGAIVSGRPSGLKDVETMAGVFINANPVRVRFPAGQPFSGVLRSVQESSILNQQFQYVSLAEIQKVSEIAGPVFDHLLIFQNYPAPVEESDAVFTMEKFEVHDRTHYDFNLVVIPGECLRFKFTFNGKVFAREEVVGIGRHFLAAIRNATLKPDAPPDAPVDAPVDKLEIFDEEEFHQIVYGFNHTACAREPGRSVIDRFEEQVRRTPDATAVVYDDCRISYAELNRRADLIAGALTAGPEDRVAVMMDRSDLLVAGILAILKAGAAYVPIDPSYPEEWRKFIVQDSGCRMLLTESFCASAIDQGGMRAEVQRRGELAYVIYTSGSTGVPKGCRIDHRNLLHYLEWADSYYPESETFSLYSSLSFDLTVTSLFLPLIRGKTLWVFPQGAGMDDILIESFSPSSPIDSIKLTPSHISLLKDLGVVSTNIRMVIVGGEALTPGQVRYLHSLNPDLQVFNEYGPTETTVGCVTKKIERGEDRVLIGRPIANTQIYILDRRLVPMPVGLSGEIYIGGYGVSRGYLNRDELNRERFLLSPFVSGERVYKTGDVGRWLEDGNIEYLGRNDDQVKIRGYRLEPQGIENHLRRHEAVRDAIVVVADSGEAGRELIAYVTGATDGLRQFLQGCLPEYMIPSHFVALERIPLTSNGKLDRKALPDPRRVPLRGEIVAPRDAVEERLAAIWRQVLQIERVGVADHFFELGGHSLKAMQVVSRIHRDLGVKLSLRAFFTNPTIEKLARMVGQAGPSRFAGIDRVPEQPHYELSHAQKRIWFVHHMKAHIAYNMPKAFLFEELPEMDALKQALDALVERHESLRTVFEVMDGVPRQRIVANPGFPIEEIDLRGEEPGEEAARRIVEIKAHVPFDLTQPPLLRATAIRIGDSRMVFLLVMHHIIGDGWSMSVFYREIFAMYEAFRRKQPHPLSPLRIQYKDFAAWQNAQDFQEQEGYWLNKLTPIPEKVRLPFDFQAPDDREFAGRTQFVDLPSDTVAGLRAIASGRNTTLSNVVLAVFDLLLHQFMKQEDICVGMAVANRHHSELENLIGIFVNILPIRVQLTPDTTFDELLDRIVENVQEAFECQDYPFDRLVEKLNPDRAAARNPLLNVIYGFQNFEDVYIDVSKEKQSPPFAGSRVLRTAKPLDVEFRTAKFDLTLFVTDMGTQLRLTMEYDVGVFADGTIRWMLTAFERFAGMARTEATHVIPTNN